VGKVSYGQADLARQKEENKQQFIHKLSVILNRLARSVMSPLQIEFLSNLRDLVGKMSIGVQCVSYLLVAVKNCGVVSAT
jgi:predicted transcriptional regulator